MVVHSQSYVLHSLSSDQIRGDGEGEFLSKEWAGSISTKYPDAPHHQPMLPPVLEIKVMYQIMFQFMKN